MHRKTFSPKSLGWLILGFVLNAAASTAPAQDSDRPVIALAQQLKESGDAKYVLVIPKDITKTIEMSSKEIILEVRSENPAVVKVNTDLENPRHVRVTGKKPGIAMVHLTDVKKNRESFEVHVENDEDSVWEQQAEYKRRSLMAMIAKAVPTASVDVRIARNNKVILTGNVPNVESIQVVLELARSISDYVDKANSSATTVSRSGSLPAEKDSVINALRVGGVQQVQIEVTIARVNRSKARAVGFSWLQTGQQHYVASAIAGGTFATSSSLPSILAPAATLSSAPNAVFGIFNDKEGFFGYLNALATENLAKFIAEPRVITQSGRPAWIVSGGKTPILTSSGVGAPSVSYETFGTVVNVLPIVMGNGKIHLEVRPEISALNAALGITLPGAVTTSVPGFDLRSAQVAVEIEDGQTLAIGGLIQNSIDAQNSKVPILGDIPFLAFAFTNKTYLEKEEEFIILVTPHLIDPLACCQLPKYLPGRETRTVDDFELFLEGILEAPRGQRNLTQPYTAAYLNGRSSSVYPCGDASGCGNRCASPGNCATPGNCAAGCAAGCAPSAAGKAFSTAGAAAASPAPQKVDNRPVADTAGDTTNPVPAPMSIQEPVPTSPAPTPSPAAAPGAAPTTLPTLPPVTKPGTSDETRLPPAVFGPAVLADR